MATPALNFNPMATTVAGGGFSTTLDGYIVGNYLDDPAVRFALAGGRLGSSETLPMWGGLPIFEDVNGSDLGGIVGRAANNAAVTGFSVFNQNYAAINTPQSPVPSIGSGGLVNFFRLGSGARIPVECDPAIASMIDTNPIGFHVSWDFTNNRLIAYDGSNTLACKVLQVAVGNSMIVTWDNTAKTASWNRSGSCAVILI